MLPSTTMRVPLHTPESSNRRIAREIEENIVYFLAHPDQIDQRLAELDREWDIERVFETQASSLSLASLFLGATVSRKWFLFTGVIASFLLLHALQGWCPPLPVLRRLGFRTQGEIELERYTLKAVRGDFNEVAGAQEMNIGSRANLALRAACDAGGH